MKSDIFCSFIVIAHDCTDCLASEFDFANHDLTIISKKFSLTYLKPHIAF
ncbi:MAG: hypothetical protein Q8S84_06035 [bacterium]|nr:hypothetical protein [bacterium]MDP3381038.1 hypothetical protein [bacterium]